ELASRRFWRTASDARDPATVPARYHTLHVEPAQSTAGGCDAGFGVLRVMHAPAGNRACPPTESHTVVCTAIFFCTVLEYHAGSILRPGAPAAQPHRHAGRHDRRAQPHAA